MAGKERDYQIVHTAIIKIETPVETLDDATALCKAIEEFVGEMEATSLVRMLVDKLEHRPMDKKAATTAGGSTVTTTAVAGPPAVANGAAAPSAPAAPVDPKALDLTTS